MFPSFSQQFSYSLKPKVRHLVQCTIPDETLTFTGSLRKRYTGSRLQRVRSQCAGLFAPQPLTTMLKSAVTHHRFIEACVLFEVHETLNLCLKRADSFAFLIVFVARGTSSFIGFGFCVIFPNAFQLRQSFEIINLQIRN